ASGRGRIFDLLTGRTTVGKLYGIEGLDDDDDKSVDKRTSTQGDETEGIKTPPHSHNVKSKKHQEISLDLANGTHMRFPSDRTLAEWTAIQARLRKPTSPTEDTPMTPADQIRDLAKRVGAVAICKVLVDEDRSYGITEPELVAMITEHFKRESPGLSDPMAF